MFTSMDAVVEYLEKVSPDDARIAKVGKLTRVSAWRVGGACSVHACVQCVLE